MILIQSPKTHQAVAISVVLPAYNERENLMWLVPEIAAQLAEHTFEILIVDDNSPDGTKATFEQLNLPGVQIVPRKSERGFALSIRDGIEASKGEIVIIMDSDGNHQAKYLPILIDNLKYYDVVVGSRFQYGAAMAGWFRHKASWIFNICTRLVSGGMITDHLYGFIAIRREGLASLDFDKIFWGYGDYCIRLLFFLQRRGDSILQIPTVNGARRFGSANSRMVSVLMKYSWAVICLIFSERVMANVRRNSGVSRLRQPAT
jgi:dolichol-phosphate mannosyltransferase